MRLNSVLARTSAAAVLLALSCAAGVAAQPGPSQVVAKTAVVDVSSVRIANFGLVSPSYYRGAQPEGRDYTDLAALGIRTIINLIGDDLDPNEGMMVERAGMKYVEIPMTTRVPPTSAQLAQFLGIVNNPASQPVYVHCVGGKHRTGVMTAVYRMTQDRWSADQAFEEMKRYKFGADFLHPEFKRFVYAFQPRPDRSVPVQTVIAASTIG